MNNVMVTFLIKLVQKVIGSASTNEKLGITNIVESNVNKVFEDVTPINDGFMGKYDAIDYDFGSNLIAQLPSISTVSNIANAISVLNTMILNLTNLSNSIQNTANIIVSTTNNILSTANQIKASILNLPSLTSIVNGVIGGMVSNLPTSLVGFLEGGGDKLNFVKAALLSFKTIVGDLRFTFLKEGQA